MSIRLVTILIFSLLAMMSAATVARRHDTAVGGYKPIKNLKDPYVQEIAKFAVAEHNKESNGHLHLVSIVKGESQVVAGTNYRLTITANDTHNYLAVVYDKPWEHYRSLTSFKSYAVVGGYKPIKNLKDPYVQEIAKFAVAEHNKESNGHLDLVSIVKGESQIVAGTNYRLTITANDTHNYLAVVYDKPWEHYKSLTSFKSYVVVGGYKPIKNLKDPYVQEIAKFAVAEHNKESNGHLEFVSIIKGESQIVAGTNYRLTITANDAHNYLVVVYDKPWEHYRSLTSYKSV